MIGSAPYCTEFAEWLVEKGHAVTVLSFRPHYPSPKDFAAWADGTHDEEVHNGVRILRVAPVSSKRGLSRLNMLQSDSTSSRQILRNSA